MTHQLPSVVPLCSDFDSIIEATKIHFLRLNTAEKASYTTGTSIIYKTWLCNLNPFNFPTAFFLSPLKSQTMFLRHCLTAFKTLGGINLCVSRAYREILAATLPTLPICAQYEV